MERGRKGGKEKRKKGNRVEKTDGWRVVSRNRLEISNRANTLFLKSKTNFYINAFETRESSLIRGNPSFFDFDHEVNRIGFDRFPSIPLFAICIFERYAKS